MFSEWGHCPDVAFRGHHDYTHICPKHNQEPEDHGIRSIVGQRIGESLNSKVIEATEREQNPVEGQYTSEYVPPFCFEHRYNEHYCCRKETPYRTQMGSLFVGLGVIDS